MKLSKALKLLLALEAIGAEKAFAANVLHTEASKESTPGSCTEEVANEIALQYGIAGVCAAPDTDRRLDGGIAGHHRKLSAIPVSLVEIVPNNPQGPKNCIPFGDIEDGSYPWGPFVGAIYKDIPAFSLTPGHKIRFDTAGTQTTVPINRNIYFGIPEQEPPVGPTVNVNSDGWTKVVSDTQDPADPEGNPNLLGNTIYGDFDLTYEAEVPFSFPGGGLVVGMDGGPETTDCPQNLGSQALASDPSGFFVYRFYSVGVGPPASSVNIIAPGVGDDKFIWSMIIVNPVACDVADADREGCCHDPCEALVVDLQPNCATSWDATCVDLACGSGGHIGRPVCDYQACSGQCLRADEPPVADAGQNQIVDCRTDVHLDGMGSSDPDGDTLSFNWIIEDVAGATVFNELIADPIVSFTEAGTYLARLTVSDGLNEDDDSIAIVVNDNVSSRMDSDA